MSADAKPVSSQHIPSLDGIRAIAFLLVFVAHAGLGNVVPGGLGVTIFFFLSGYLITTLLRQEWEQTGQISIRAFYVRRMFRILPPMYLTLAVAGLLATVRFLPSGGESGGILAALMYACNYFGLIRDNFELPTGMEVLWSLAVEEHFYLIFPFVYIIFVRRRMSMAAQSRVLLAFCALVLLWRTYLVYVAGINLNVSHPWTYIASDCRMDSIAWGCLLAIRNNPIYDGKSSFLGRHQSELAIAGVGLLLLSLIERDPRFRESLRYSIQGVALYPIFYFCVSSNKSYAVRWLELRWLREIGWLSYTLYLIHFSILLGLGLLIQSPSIAGFVAFVVTFAYGKLMQVFVEAPLRGLRARLTAKKPRISRANA
jgi:peptidoglycan/LPS O-acetylase OafA/YrhL